MPKNDEQVLQPDGVSPFAWLTISDAERKRLRKHCAEVWWERQGKYMTNEELMSYLGKLAKGTL